MNQNSSKQRSSDFLWIKSNSKTAEQTLKQEKAPKDILCEVQPFNEENQKSINYTCKNCEQSLQKVTKAKKSSILLQYQNAKLSEQNQKLKEQNKNLKFKLAQKIKVKLGQIQHSYVLTMKQDLQAQLFESKLMNQFLMMAQMSNQNTQTKQKLQKLVMQRLVLDQQLQQKNKIINDTVLYPIYHYDSRIKNLREIVCYFYNYAIKQCKKSQQMTKLLKKEIDVFKTKIKTDIQSLVYSNLNIKQLTYGKGKQNIDGLNKIKKSQNDNTRLYFTDDSSLNLIEKTGQRQIKKKLEQVKAETKIKKRAVSKKSKQKNEKTIRHTSGRRQQKLFRPCCSKINN